jgi:type II secretory pathway component PulK
MRKLRSESGVALVTAIGLLFIFSMLSMVYIGYALTELDRARYDARAIRARHIARGGIEAAIGSLTRDVADKKSFTGPRQTEYPFDFYKYDVSAPNGVSPDPDRRWVAKVTVTDESGKINLNFASARVLQSVLGVDGDTARQIRGALPNPDPSAPAEPGRTWLASLDDLVTRGMVAKEEYAKFPKELITVHSVADAAWPYEHLNINAAEPKTLAAILGVSEDEAAQVAAKKPFDSLASLSAAANRPPSAFNIKPSQDAPDALPRELSLQSRCFRIECEANLMLKNVSGESSVAQSWVEAVVVFDKDGAANITFWREAPRKEDAGKA